MSFNLGENSCNAIDRNPSHHMQQLQPSRTSYGWSKPTPLCNNNIMINNNNYRFSTNSYNTQQNADKNRLVQYPLWDSPVLVYDSSRFVTSPVPHDLLESSVPSLVFESRFECGNLALAFRV